MFYAKRSKSENNDASVDLTSKKMRLSFDSSRDVNNDVIPCEMDISGSECSFIANRSFGPESAPVAFINISDQLLVLEREQCSRLKTIQFDKSVSYIYNPIEYAFAVHARYVQRYCNTTKKILFLGMNPGPWGMTQTGVPFGEVNIVRDWLKLSGYIGKPPREHPDRKVTGFDCTRSEVSGRRFWSLFQELCGTPENFFRHAFLHNYCPIALLNNGGRNITPTELKIEDQRELYKICDEALLTAIKLLDIQVIVGVGRFAEKRAEIVVNLNGLRVQVLSLPHPSPRSVGNQNWYEKAKQRLEEIGLLSFFTSN